MNNTSLSDRLGHYVETSNWPEIERLLNREEYVKHLGIHVDLSEPDSPICAIEQVKAFHLGGVGQDYVNGAVITGLFDLVLGLTALKFTGEGNIATTNIHIRMLKPVVRGRLYVAANINKRMNGSVFSEATLFDW